ncbi:hypothetical protein AAG906_009699 [Vitis piasezkii]
MNINLNDKVVLEYCLVWKTSRGEPFLKACMSKFKCIKMLDLSYLNFDTLPNSISCRFSNVRDSRICPRSLGTSSVLRNLCFTTKQRALIGIGHLESLHILRIYECENLEFLLQGTQSLTALRSLAIGGCRSLETLAPSMKQLPSLEHLMNFDYEKLNSLDGNGEDHMQENNREDWHKISHVS